MFVLYLSADACYEAMNQFTQHGTVMEQYKNQVEIYTLEGFEIAFNQNERISDLGYVKFMDAANVDKNYKS